MKKVVIKRLLTLINQFRGIKGVRILKATPCEVMILDEEGSDCILKCIPSHVVVNILPTRGDLTLIKSITFFANLIISLLQFKRPGLSLQMSIVAVWKPKLLITFIDNSQLGGVLKSVFPQIHLISVQNGSRWDLANPKIPKLFLDHYFCFGENVSDIFSQSGHNAAHYYMIGSLRAGLANVKTFDQKRLIFDLCFISNFSILPDCSEDSWNYNVELEFLEKGNLLFELVLKFAEKNDLKLCVAMKCPGGSEGAIKEYEHFKKAIKGTQMIPRNEFSSYEAVQSSRLSITMESTLAYETLGFGMPIMKAFDIGNLPSITMVDRWSFNPMTYKWPELQTIDSLDFDEFSDKAVKLLKMPHEEYIEYSRDAREYYMNINPSDLPHQIIKRKIEELLF